MFGQRRVDVDIGARRVLGGEGAGRGGRFGGGGTPVAEPGADRGLDLRRIEIADDDQGGVARHVFAVPEVLERLGARRLQRLVGADRQAADIVRAGVEELDLVEVIADLEPVPVALFGKDHPALALHRAGIEAQLADRLAHQHQRDAQQFLVAFGEVEPVGGGLETRGGIGVRAEGQAVAFKQLDHLALGHVGRSVEGHVLDEMGKAALGVLLVQRAGIDLHAHQRRAPGRGVGADRVAHPVRQLAEGKARIERNVALRESPDRARLRCAGDLLRARGAGGEGDGGKGEGEEELGVTHWPLVAECVSAGKGACPKGQRSRVKPGTTRGYLPRSLRWADRSRTSLGPLSVSSRPRRRATSW